MGDKFQNYLQIIFLYCYKMNFCRQCVNCYCCSYWACSNSIFINCWQALESCGFSYLYCSACFWALCAPICIDCEIGSGQTAISHCIKALKYCCLGCALNCMLPADCINNCFKICGKNCGEDKLVVHQYELIEHAQTYGKSVIQFFGV